MNTRTLNLDAIPANLRALDRWIVYRLEHDPKKPKPDKVPYTAREVGSGHRKKASTTDSATWCSFDMAAAVVRGGDRFAGIGFVLGDGFAGVDLDGCRNPETGALTVEAAGIVKALASYTEVSPSGTGVHILARGTLPPGRRKHGKIEAYEHARYFTVTGEHLDGTPDTVEERTEALAAFHAKYFPAPDNGNGNGNGSGHVQPVSLENDELLKRAVAAKHGADFARLWSGDTSAHDGDESRADLALCLRLAFWCGRDPERMDRLFRNSGLMREKWDSHRGDSTYGRQTIEKALALHDGETYSPPRPRGRPRKAEAARLAPEEGDDSRPEIVISTEIARVTDEAERVLLDSGAGIYTRGGRAGRALVRVVRDTKRNGEWLTRPRGAPVIAPASLPYLRETLGRVARWVQIRETRSGEREKVPALVPKWAPETLDARGEWIFPILEGVIEVPTFRVNGTILATPGYDPETALLYEPCTDFPEVPEYPAAEEAHTAARYLLAPFREFPFVTEGDRAATLAAILTVTGRSAFSGPAPMFTIRATAPGTGKTLLADAISTITTGRAASRMVHGKDDDETRKRLLALGLEGAPVVLLDNVERVLGSESLAAALTTGEEGFTDRLLGSTKTITVPLRMVWLATGNGLTFRGDLGRRVVPIDLDAEVENPEEREFEEEHLLAYVQRERARLVVASLTILRAYHLAGRPRHGAPRMGSFEAWDDLIRGACVWAGIGDPCEGRARIREEGDEDRDALRVLHQAWRGAFGDEPQTVAHALDRAKGDNGDQDLRAALAALDPKSDGAKINPRAVGDRLRKWRGRVVDGARLERAGESHKVARWIVRDTL